MAAQPRTRPRRRPRRPRRGAVALLAFLLAASVGQARAATFTVNNAADTTDGICGPAVGECTLREAIQAAVATAGRDTIVFDPTVFPHGSGAVGILLTSPLPVIADGAGTVVDGSGADVRIGGGSTVGPGLVFASAPGVPLMKVTVANVLADAFTGTAVQICGGVPPGCDEDVSGVLVRNVGVTTAGGDGIRIEGRTVAKARVVDSVTSNTDGPGIRFFATASLIDARVEGCLVREGDNDGILLKATGSIVGATVRDTEAVRNGETGVAVSGQAVTNTKLTNVVAAGNGLGVLVVATGSNGGAKLDHVVASNNGDNGVLVEGTTTGLALKNVSADANGVCGVNVAGVSTGTKVAGGAMVENGDCGLILGESTGARATRTITAGNLVVGFFFNGGGNVAQGIVGSGNGDEGIGLQSFNGNAVKKSTAAGNRFTGIGITSGSTGNSVLKNVALGNGLTDLFDGNPGCANDTWKGNVFVTGSEPCIQ